MDILGVSGLKEMHQVNLTWLPSKGACYPEDMELFVSPLMIRERRLLEGASQAEYYRKLLEGITIKGSNFNKNDLLFADVEFLDIVRRLYTFELDKSITIKNYPCKNCGGDNIELSFMFNDIEFEDMNPDIFGKVETFTNDETGEKHDVLVPGKWYKFSDGMEVLVSPMTVNDYINLATTYLSNISENKLNERATDIYIGHFTYIIKEVRDRQYPDDKARRNFLKSYISNLYKDADAKVLDLMEKEVTANLKGIKATCPDCGAEVEVYVHPTLTFQQ